MSLLFGIQCDMVPQSATFPQIEGAAPDGILAILMSLLC